jgi:hypothetical protein
MDLRATLGYEAFKKDGMGLFVKAMTDPEAAGKLATDMQTLLEAAWNQKGQAGGAMMLCRLVGYVEGLAGVVDGIHKAGVQFLPIEDEDGQPISLRVVLYPESKAKPAKPTKPPTDLDKLNGQEYEAALAKMTDAERAAHLKND